MITGFITREAAEELFKQEAFLFSATSEGVAEYRAVELFGESALKLIKRGHLVGGVDYNLVGDVSNDRPMMKFFYKKGFMEIVAEHNYSLAMQEYRASQSGCLLDALEMERLAELEAKEAEEERKRQERKAKREAKAKERKGVE